jgi:hypothetical protein
MKLDRTRALVLVGLLASSCVITTEDDDDDNNNAGEAGAPGEGGSTSTGGKSSTGGVSAAGEASSDGGVAGAGDSTSEGGAAGAPAPSEEGGSGSGGEAASTGGTTSGGSAGAGGTTGGKANSTGGASTDEGLGGEGGAGEEPLCSDAEGDYPGCEGIAVDPSCEGADTFQYGKCESAPTYFKPRIAENIQYCILTQTPEELCDPELTEICADEAIQDSCPDDDEAVDACATIIDSCVEVGLDACLVYLSAMTTLGKEQTIACMEEGLACDLYSCAREL